MFFSGSVTSCVQYPTGCRLVREASALGEVVWMGYREKEAVNKVGTALLKAIFVYDDVKNRVPDVLKTLGIIKKLCSVYFFHFRLNKLFFYNKVLEHFFISNLRRKARLDFERLRVCKLIHVEVSFPLDWFQ